MKKIKKTYFSIINKIIAIIATFTGLQSCDFFNPPLYSPPPIDPPAPHTFAYFTIAGKVETKLKTPIPHIEIEMTSDNELINNSIKPYGNNVCDDLGNFTIYHHIDEYNYPEDEFIAPKEITLIFKDTDGEQYGEFKTDTIIVPLEFTKDTTYSNSPYRAEVTDLVVTLEEKEQNNNEENDNE